MSFQCYVILGFIDVLLHCNVHRIALKRCLGVRDKGTLNTCHASREIRLSIQNIALEKGLASAVVLDIGTDISLLDKVVKALLSPISVVACTSC